jgi:hypothetical protein
MIELLKYKWLIEDKVVFFGIWLWTKIKRFDESYEIGEQNTIIVFLLNVLKPNYTV